MSPMRRGILGDVPTSCTECHAPEIVDAASGAELHMHGCSQHDPWTCFTCLGGVAAARL